jgi:general secretion pathway protein G
MCSRFQHPRRRAAFTLVELMVVIVLIGLLAGAVAVGTRQYIISGKRAVAKLEISRICQALDTFYTAYDRFPTNDEGIEVLAQPGDKFAAALLSEAPKDPWGRPYEYIHPGRETAYEVLSFGADGREGGTGADGDISSTALDENDQNTKT